MNGRLLHQVPQTGSSARSLPLAARTRAFTLLEMLIAVGAVALIAVGLARVFSAAGQTVRVGTKVSRLNESAALIERQIREDIAGMSRGGFLVIVNERADEYHNPDHTNNGLPIALSADAPVETTRPRRIDQLLFFADGSFVSKRQGASADAIATASQARIYYGHGLSWADDANTRLIEVEDERQSDRNGPQNSAPGFGSPGPNQYAADWTLLRHVTLLTQPSPQPKPGFNAHVRDGTDNDYQIAGQPACPSIFRLLEAPTKPSQTARWADDAVRRPGFACGVVDIATTTLAEVRAVVLDEVSPNLVAGNGYVWRPDLDDPSGSGAISFQPTPGFVSNNSSLTRMKFWMKYALPTWSDGLYANRNNGYRMHCERVPPNLLGTRNPQNRGALNQEYQRADQMMLASSNFVPACTEFIVEWSFGLAHPPRSSPSDVGGPPGEIIWHGLERWVDVNGDGVIDRSNGSPDRVVAKPYLDGLPQTDLPPAASETFARDSAVMYNGLQPYDPAYNHAPPPDGNTKEDIVPSELIHGEAYGDNGLPPATLYSYFGYLDPTYQGAGTRDWPWPKLLRITMSLTDPADPTTERTFQFVVELPERREAAQY